MIFSITKKCSRRKYLYYETNSESLKVFFLLCSLLIWPGLSVSVNSVTVYINSVTMYINSASVYINSVTVYINSVAVYINSVTV